MTIVQVRYVLEVARCLNISHAAKHLFVTQSALSQQIARLESELGYLLFQREVHGLRLTKEGEAFCRAAEPVLEAWTQFSQYALSLCASGRRSLRIVIGPRVYSNRLFGDIVQYFDAHTSTSPSSRMRGGISSRTSRAEPSTWRWTSCPLAGVLRTPSPSTAAS